MGGVSLSAVGALGTELRSCVDNAAMSSRFATDGWNFGFGLGARVDGDRDWPTRTSHERVGRTGATVLVGARRDLSATGDDETAGSSPVE